MTFTSSIYSYIDPIRTFKANDPAYYEVENIPLEQIQNNCRWLKDQIEFLTNNGSLGRENFTELKPYVDDTNNIVRVKPGRFSARINDAYNKTYLQKLQLVSQITGGDFRQYQTILATSAFDVLIDKIHSSVATDAVYMNGLAERVLEWRIVNPDTANVTGSIGGLPSTGGSPDIDRWPVVFTSPFRKYFIQNYGTFADLPKLSSEFIKMWRGVARTAIVDIPDELTISIPAFNPDDFRKTDTNGTTQILNANTRIDLVFIYSHPIDTSSTTINKYTNNVPQTITAPTLGIVKGAGVILTKLASTANPAFYNATTKALDSNGNPQILANVADQTNTDNGFQGLNIHGSFPSPDDLMNITPNLIESLESTDYQLIGQSILPVCYVVVRKNASVNSAGQQVILSTDIIDIRPFFRTTELSYNERAGIAAASPPISLANPAIGQAQFEYEVNKVYTKIQNQLNNNQVTSPKVVAGGIVWGGTQFGAEGSIRNAARLIAGISTANLPFQEAPTYPDWDLADWWTMYPLAVNDKGQRRNDRVNLYRAQSGVFDSGTNLTNANSITSAERRLGVEHVASYFGSLSFYWCKKEILIDRVLVPWMSDYTVDCQLLNCIGQTSRSSYSGNNNHDDEAGAYGVWIEYKSDRFIVYVGWIADTPALWAQHNYVIHGREPKDDRDTYGFSGFAVRHSDMGLPSVDNISYNSIASKAPIVGACTYPSISFKVTGYPAGYFFKSLAQYPNTALITLQ